MSRYRVGRDFASSTEGDMSYARRTALELGPPCCVWWFGGETWKLIFDRSLDFEQELEQSFFTGSFYSD